MRRLVLALALGLAAAAAPPARADSFQRWGAEVWPGKNQVGFHPFGIQARFDGLSTGGYHMTLDFARRIRDLERISVWIGGGLNWAHPSYSCKLNLTGCANDVELWGFVRLTFEKMLSIPLVPFVDGGLAIDILPFGTNAGTITGAALAVRFGGGIHYWIIQHLGLGLESHFTLGPGFYPAAVIGGPSGTNVSTYGNWDLVFGMRASF
ncbi:MAG TPA: hypothetical protein VFF06_35950 [Polyangia bacterium]|nr:hypothetical protein [Polyangia bacterium]